MAMQWSIPAVQVEVRRSGEFSDMRINDWDSPDLMYRRTLYDIHIQMQNAQSLRIRGVESEFELTEEVFATRELKYRFVNIVAIEDLIQALAKSDSSLNQLVLAEKLGEDCKFAVRDRLLELGHPIAAELYL